MNKYQQLNFDDIEDFMAYLPAQELAIVSVLRDLILEGIPNVREKLAYNVPYYYKNSRACFIWPPSIPWGNTNIKGVQLGFCNGYLMRDDLNYLEKGARKQVYWKEFTSISEIDADILKAYIYEAVAIDEQVKNNKSFKHRNKRFD